MWSASPTAVTSYTVNANDEACASTTVGEMAPLTTVPSTELSAQVSGLTSGTTYCLVVTASDVNDVSPLAIGTAPPDADNTVELTTQRPPETTSNKETRSDKPQRSEASREGKK